MFLLTLCAVRGRALSLFVCICKGEFDEILEWPFAHEITLTLVDQKVDPKRARDIVYRVHPNPSISNLQFLGRPIGERNARCAIVFCTRTLHSSGVQMHRRLYLLNCVLIAD